MNMEDVSRAGVEFGNGAGERLQTMLGRLPSPQEFMLFYGTAAASISGNALSEIVKAAGKETGAQWLTEVLGMIQLTARGNGADIVLAGGITLKTVASTMSKQPAAPPAPPAPPASLTGNICPCEISKQDGTCRSCEREIDRSIDRFTSLIKNAVDISREAERTKVCPVCKIRLFDGLLAKSIRKNASSFGDRLSAALEIFMAVVMPQLKAMMPEASLDETLKAVSETAATIKK
jgi:hypothetical protein